MAPRLSTTDHRREPRAGRALSTAGPAVLLALFLLFAPVYGAEPYGFSKQASAGAPTNRAISSFSVSLPDASKRRDTISIDSALADGNGEVREVVQRLEDALADVRDVQQRLLMDIINPSNGSVTRAEGTLRGRMPDLFRVDFSAPDVLAGVTVIVDLAQNEVWQFQPITEQIVVQPWDQMAKERGIEFDVQGWLGLPDPEKFHLTKREDGYIDDRPYIVLEGTPREEGNTSRYEFFINPDRWWVEALRLYDGHDNLIFSASMDEVAFNQGLDERRLRSLPAGADVIRR